MLAIDTETTGLFIHKGCQAFTISAACHKHKTYLWKFPVNPFTRQVEYSQSLIQDFKDTLAQHEELIFHNANFDLQVLDAIGIPSLFSTHNIHDTMVMSHAYKSNNLHSLKTLGVTILEFPEDDEKELSVITKEAQKQAKSLNWNLATKHSTHPSLQGLQKEHWRSDYWLPEQLAIHLNLPTNHRFRHICDEYAKNDAIRTLGLYIIFQELMTAKQKISYHKARKLIKPILDMQYEKVTVIDSELTSAKLEYQTKSTTQLIRIRNIVKDRDFNPASPKQLSSLLFDKYKFPVKKLSVKTGKPSTDKDVISALLKDCPTTGPIPLKYKYLIEHKRLKKTNTTLQYINNYDKHRNANNEIQPFFKQTGTGTNRLACENPNTTNVGKADMNNPFNTKDVNLLEEHEESFKLRNVFGPKEGETWTCIDYVQFQLLIFAIVSNTPQLVDDYLNGLDLHDAVARRIFKSDVISSEQRTAAKAVNFGLLFGAGPDKIETIAGIPGLYNIFLKQLPGAKRYLEASTAQARSKGYVHTLGGYRLYVPRERTYAASCYIIQGTEAEIVRSAMISVNEYTYSSSTKNFITQSNLAAKYRQQIINTKSKCPYKMLMMVHDELVFRSSKKSIPHVKNLMTLMEQAGAKLGVPVKVDAEVVHNNWATKIPLDLTTPA